MRAVRPVSYLLGACLIGAGFLGTALLAGCTTNPATGKSEFTAFVSKADEAKIGRREDVRLTAEFGGAYPDPALQTYVSQVGERLALVSETPAAPFRFKVLNDPSVNAFALPGGYVYVTRGLLALASDESELAAVLGHEIGHVVARHTAQRESRAEAANIGLNVVGVIAGVLGAPFGTGMAASVGTNALLQSYSRDQEREADRLGMRYMRRAGYDGAGMVRLFKKLERVEAIRKDLGGNANSGALAAVMASHPQTKERLAAAEKMVRDGGDGSGVPPTGMGIRARMAYLDHVDGLRYGRSLAAGAVRDGRYVSLSDDLSFEVPPGFKLKRVGDTVTGDGPGGAVLAVDTRVPTSPVADLKAYIATIWAAALHPPRVESLSAGPFEAATAGVRAVNGDGSHRDLRFVVLRRPGGRRLHRFLLTTTPDMTARLDAVMHRLILSAKLPSPAEVAALEPLRIEVVTVTPGTTRAQLLSRMAPLPLAARRFDAINGLAPGAAPAAGSRVKLIVSEPPAPNA